MKPNIFKFATSELSQDAFFSWLFSWADEDSKEFDENLHKCANDFIKRLISKQLKYDKDIRSVIVKKQWNHIDIFVEVNNEIFIVIEDKTSSFEHSNQLNRYKKIAEEYCRGNNHKLILIYLKTSLEFGDLRKNIEGKGYSKIDRKELINFFINYKNIKNNIFQDYFERLKKQESDNNCYKDNMIKNWYKKSSSWIGFYKELENHIDVKNWRYVNNPKNGFYGLWWNFIPWQENKVYLQIEQETICFKIEAKKDKSSVRNKFFKLLMKVAKENNMIEINKPRRFGSGTWMTVAVIDKSDWLGKDDEIVNINTVVKNLKKYETFLNKVVEADCSSR